jgi:hypothetical protein
MEHLYQQNRTWTALWDVDEYIVFQGYGRKDKQNETIVSPTNLAEPGTVLKYLQETEIKACAPISRVQVGDKRGHHVAAKQLASAKPTSLQYFALLISISKQLC